MPSAITLEGTSIRRAAELLAEHRRRRAPLDGLPDELRPSSLADGYAIQDELVALLTAEHATRTIGWKAACTNPIAQAALHIDRPLFGRLFDHSSLHTPATLEADLFTTRVIECEFAIRMARDVPPSTVPYSAATIVAFVEQVLPAIEVVDHRYRDWSLGAPSIAADNAIHGFWIYGPPFADDWKKLDLAEHALEVRVNGDLMGVGTGAAVLGHPFNVLAWLANELPEYGHQLRAGELISTGVCTDVFTAGAGDTVLADFGALGTVSLRWV